MAVGAIASSISVLLTASALIVAVRTYLNNSRAAARSQASLVSAYRTRTRATTTVDGREFTLIEIQITNSSEADVFDLSLLLNIRRKKDRTYQPQGNWVSSSRHGRCGRWTLGDGGVVPPGISTLRIYVDTVQFGGLIPIWQNVGVGFLDRNGRAWTRRLDGTLIENWTMPRS